MQFKPITLAAIVFSVCLSPRANAATLTGFLESETGPLNAIVWTIGVTNATSMSANDAAIGSVTLTQVAGAACTPVITPGAAIGTIAANTTGFGSATIDFTGCQFDDSNFPNSPPTGPQFDLHATFVADGFRVVRSE